MGDEWEDCVEDRVPVERPARRAPSPPVDHHAQSGEHAAEPMHVGRIRPAGNIGLSDASTDHRVRRSALAAPSGGAELPAGLRAGLESLSGVDMSGVDVRYDSPEPGRIGALAFARGDEIHLGRGQERHLPHEAWHVVQQRQGRVEPSVLAKGAAINADPQLEDEADVMGARALRRATPMPSSNRAPRRPAAPRAVEPVIQGIWPFTGYGYIFNREPAKATPPKQGSATAEAVATQGGTARGTRKKGAVGSGSGRKNAGTRSPERDPSSDDPSKTDVDEIAPLVATQEPAAIAHEAVEVKRDEYRQAKQRAEEALRTATEACTKLLAGNVLGFDAAKPTNEQIAELFGLLPKDSAGRGAVRKAGRDLATLARDCQKLNDSFAAIVDPVAPADTAANAARVSYLSEVDAALAAVGRIKAREFGAAVRDFAEESETYLSKVREYMVPPVGPKAKQPAAGGAQAGDAQADADPEAARLARYVWNDSSTWDLNAVEYKNGQSAAVFGGDAGLLVELARGLLAGNARGRGKELIVVDKAFHAHLAGGSHGVAFAYRLEADHTVTPVVFDHATGRTNDNKYKWANSANGYNSAASFA